MEMTSKEYCPRCGDVLTSGDKYCGACGVATPDRLPTLPNSGEPISAFVSSRVSTTQTRVGPRRGATRMMTVGTVCVAALGIGAFASAWFRGNSSNSRDNNADVTAATADSATPTVSVNADATIAVFAGPAPSTAAATQTSAPVPVPVTAGLIPQPKTTMRVGAPTGSVLARDEIIAAVASSELLPNDQGVTYFIGNALDGNPDTAWNSAGPVPPEGITLSFEFATPVDLRQLQISNGYQVPSRRTTFDENGRVGRLEISGGGLNREALLKDIPEAQVVNLDLGTVSSVTLTVLTIYHGTSYSEVAITQIDFIVG